METDVEVVQKHGEGGDCLILENKHHICLLAAALTAGILLAGEHPSVQHVFPAVLLLFACAAGLYKSILHVNKLSCCF